jgi:hypothetical protein
MVQSNRDTSKPVTLQCKSCSTHKPLSEYHKSAQEKWGVRKTCKECWKPIRAAQYAKNREQAIAYSVAWNRENPEKAKSYSLAADARNPNRHRLSKAKRYAEKGEEVRAYNSAWDKANRATCAAKLARYRSTKRRATPAWSNNDRIKEFYFAADFLGMVTGEWHNVDHIVPLQSDLVCGLHCEANLQVLPEFENQSKGNRFWPDMP